MPLVEIDPNFTIPDTVIRLTPLQEELQCAIVTATERIAIPPICFEVMDGDLSSEIGTLGNISLWIGKAKQGKTFALTMALAAAETGEWLMNKLKITLPEDNKTILLFDTEQSRYHVQRVIKRIAKLSEIDEPINLTAFGLRKYTPARRLELIEYALYNTENIGFVVIDGIRDLITSINDEEQSTMISSKLLRWSEELNIHIAVVLHTNKADNNARGHLGTELTNKSESVISIGKDPDIEDQMVIKPEYCRSREFIPFGFKIDDYGNPYIVEIQNLNPEKRKSLSPVDIPSETHLLILDAIFKIKKDLKYSELIPQIKDYFMRHGISFGENKAKEFATFYQNDLYIESFKPEKGNTLYRKITKLSIPKSAKNSDNYDNELF
jgi:hypothetical protein